MESEMKADLQLLSEFAPHTLEQWKQAVIDSLKGADYDRAMLTKTHEGITLKPIYTKEDLEGKPWTDALPGQAPYTRGNNPDGYTRQPWIVAQVQDEPSLTRLNKTILDELNRGLTCVQLILHPSTLNGKLPSKADADKRGVPLCHLQDFTAAVQGVDFTAVPLMITGNHSLLLTMGMLDAWAKETGFDLKQLHGAIASDPFSDEEPNYDALMQMTRWAGQNAPHLRTILLDATVYEAQGASAVEELAYTMASAHQILDELTRRGFNLERVAPRFVLKLSLGSNLFMEIAKVRAARMLWAQLIKSWNGSEDAQKIWIHGSTASFNKSNYDIWVNMLRTTTEGFAGVIGGIDSLQIEPYDSHLRPADEFSRRIARNQQLVLAEEAQFTKIIDPAGGCWYIEALTSQLCDKAWQRLQEIDAQGGMQAVLANGSIHAELQTISADRITAVNNRRDVKVGVNMFANPADELIRIPDPDTSWLDETMQRYAQLKKDANLDPGASLQALDDMPKTECWVKQISAAWQQGADIEQISTALKLKFSPRPVNPTRSVAIMEELRTRVEASPADTRIYLLNLGSIAEYKARMDFSTGFFQTAGFPLIESPGFTDLDEAATAAGESSAPAVCICSTDDMYSAHVPALCARLKALDRPPLIILAGYPKDKVEDYAQAGVDLFIHLRANAHDTNKIIANKMGVTL